MYVRINMQIYSNDRSFRTNFMEYGRFSSFFLTFYIPLTAARLSRVRQIHQSRVRLVCDIVSDIDIRAQCPSTLLTHNYRLSIIKPRISLYVNKEAKFCYCLNPTVSTKMETRGNCISITCFPFRVKWQKYEEFSLCTG